MPQSRAKKPPEARPWPAPSWWHAAGGPGQTGARRDGRRAAREQDMTSTRERTAFPGPHALSVAPMMDWTDFI